MGTERTLTIIKPDAVAAGHVGDIIKIFEANQFKIVAARLVRLSKKEAEGSMLSTGPKASLPA